MAPFATVTIQCAAFTGSSTRTVKCSAVVIGFKRDIDVKPNANPGTLAYVQTQSQENPTYVLQNVRFTGESGVLSYADLLTLGKINFTGSNSATLTIKYGTASTLVGYDGSTTAIPVIVKDFSVNIDTRDSKDGYLPAVTISLVETKTG